MPPISVMRGSRMAVALSVIAGLSIAATADAQEFPAGFRAEFLHQFGQSMWRVLALAEAVTAATYARRPVPAVQPLAHTFAHIARALRTIGDARA